MIRVIVAISKYVRKRRNQFMRRIISKILKIVLGNARQSFFRRIDYLIKKFKGGYFSIDQLDKQLEQYVNYDMVSLSN